MKAKTQVKAAAAPPRRLLKGGFLIMLEDSDFNMIGTLRSGG